MATYKTLYDDALSRLTSLCKNVSDYANLPAQFKSGYTYEQRAGSTRMYMVYTIQNPIAQADATAITNAFQTVMQQCGVYGVLNNEITPKGLLNFYNALSLFCRHHVRICSSQLVSTNYVVFIPGTVEYNIKLSEGNIIQANDILLVNHIVDDIIKSSCKPYCVRYSATYTIK